MKLLPGITAAAALAASIQVTACAEPSKSAPYEADRRPAVFVNFAPRNPTPENPHGYQRHWLKKDTAAQWMRTQLARGDRIIIRTPFGNGLKDWVTSKQWLVAEDWRRALFIRVINRWLAGDPERTFSLYLGTLVGDPTSRSMQGARSPDVDDPEAMQDFLATVKPWLEATRVHRLWLDHSSLPVENRRNVVKLARWCRENLDLVVGMEALPRNGDELDHETMEQLPTLATWRYCETFDKEARWRLPAGAEVHLIVIPQPRSPKPTLDAIRAYRKRGFIVGSGHHEYDWMVRQANEGD